MKILIAIVFCLPLVVRGQPNVLWITLEDTSPHFIGCYGNAEANTPNIDRLSAEGVKFTNAFANSPVCSSARSTIITGVLNEALGTGNHRSNYPLPDYISGFPSFLKNSGWYTSNNVKTDYATADAKRLIRESWHESSKKAGWWGRRSNQRFFSVFNFVDSHQSRTMTNPQKWYESFVFDKLDDALRANEDSIEMPPFLRDSPQMRRYLSRVYNAIALADKNIGLLLDSLRRDGLMDETIIFLYADHGEAIPGGKSGSVGIGYKVPFIVWFPEKYRHLSPWGTETETDELVNFDDLGPTMLSIAGIEAPGYMTGRPIMGKYRKPPPQYIFMSRNRIDETPGLTRSVTDGRFMYSKVFLPQFPELRSQKYADVSDIVRQIRGDFQAGRLDEKQSAFLVRRLGTEYLYDLQHDPWKVNNLANDKRHQQVVARLRGEVKDHILKIEDVMFIPEYSLDELSAYTTPYEYRQTEKYHLPGVLETAMMGGRGENIEKLIDRVKAKDQYMQYWALMGLHGLRQVDWKNLESILLPLMDNSYIPVQVIASVIAWEQFEDEKAGSKIRAFLRSDNPLIVLQTVQLIQYGDSDFEQELTALIASRKDEKSFLNPVSAAETILFYRKGRPLYYENMKNWISRQAHQQN